MRYYIISGEPSGDLHAHLLIQALREEDPGAEIRHRVSDPSRAVMGFREVFRKAGPLIKEVFQCRSDISAFKPDVLILVDYPGFNLPMARWAHGRGLKVFWYIAPKVWASREGRIHTLESCVDRLYLILPFEQGYFIRKGVPYVYKGNPLADLVADTPISTREEFLRRHGLPDRPFIALFPGSRAQETASMMPVYVAAAEALHKTEGFENHCFLIAAAPSFNPALYAGYLRSRSYIRVVRDDAYGVLRHSQAAAINSGTASLEAALCDTPQVVCYRTGWLNALIIKALIKVKFVSLVNLILDREAVKELLQKEFTAENLTSELCALVDNPTRRQRMLADYARVRKACKGGGVCRAVARDMMQSLR